MLVSSVPADYQAALNYLYSFINYESNMPLSPRHACFNLDRMRWLLSELGDPHQCFPSVVVAGTKGKGSTCAMLDSMVRAGGYRTGLFTSPHLHCWRERIQVNRTLISQQEVVAYVDQLKPLVARLVERDQPTVFELATAIALRYFADQEVDLAVLEIGLGGRYDTVNVVIPTVSVIMPISYDHMAVLGNTLTEIASAKAGIIKPGVPVVVAPQEKNAEAVILTETKAKNAPLWCANEWGMVQISSPHAVTNGHPNTTHYPIAIEPTTVALFGEHQLVNARVAVVAALLLRQAGMLLSDGALARGLHTVSWPGRLEIVSRNPLIVVDGAMNGASAERLRAALDMLPHRQLILVLGTSYDKDIGAIAHHLVPGAAAVVLTRSFHPRAATVELLTRYVEPELRSPEIPLLGTNDIASALDLARRLTGPNDLICVAGSLYVVAAAREAMGLVQEIE